MVERGYLVCGCSQIADLALHVGDTSGGGDLTARRTAPQDRLGRSEGSMQTGRVVLALVAVLLASPSLAGSFEELEASAQRIDALEPFLARYVGRCTDRFERATCERNVAAARKEVAGRTFAVRVSDAAPLVRLSVEREGFVLLLTPFVDGGGIALTHGAPTRQDAAGRPLVNLLPIRGRLPPGTLEMELQAPFRTGAIDLEIVFRPEKAWKLPRRGERGDLEGVAARFLGIRVLDARTGREIATRTL
jgi:hypothetical protein